MSFFNLEKKQKQLKKYALKTALKSDYARRTYDMLPTWLVSYILRTFVDMTIFYRFYTNNYILNLIFAVFVSVAVTMASPFFYDVVWQYQDHIQNFTNHVVNHMSWNYYFAWRNRIVLTTASAIIFILYMDWVVITNWWVIECIIHTLVCGFILGQYEEWRESLIKPKVLAYEIIDLRKKMKYVKPIPPPCKRAHAAYADMNELFLKNRARPQRAVVIPKNSNLFKGMNILKQKNI